MHPTVLLVHPDANASDCSAGASDYVDVSDHTADTSHRPAERSTRTRRLEQGSSDRDMEEYTRLLPPSSSPDYASTNNTMN